MQRGEVLIVSLAGGDESGQRADIARAKIIATAWE